MDIGGINSRMNNFSVCYSSEHISTTVKTKTRQINQKLAGQERKHEKKHIKVEIEIEKKKSRRKEKKNI